MKLFFGTFQMNDSYQAEKLFHGVIDIGIRSFDIAPSYGTAEALGTVLRNRLEKIERHEFCIQDKVDADQMLAGYNNPAYLKKFILDRLNILHIGYFDSYLIHWPFQEYFDTTWNIMSELKAENYIHKLGVCNIDKRKYVELFTNNGLEAPDIIQNEITPLNTGRDDVAFFQDQGCEIQAYSPLARMGPDIKNSEILRRLSEKYNVSIPRIILKWDVQNNIVPVFTSRKLERVQENINLDFELTGEELEQINSMNQNYKIFPISHGCPGY